jgi:NAD(P)-dependent dehydrogenase (short-subunit alcohol dehydrogenase family)
MKVQPRRIINTASISHTDCQHHLHRLDYKNLQFEKGNCWTAYDSYGLSKLLVIMFTRGLWHLKKTKRGRTGCTLLNMDPGTVNTKMLIAGWGACGMTVEEATDTLMLATEEKYDKPKEIPNYYV